MWHWHWHQQYHMTKKSFCTSFWLSGHTECNGSIDNAVSVMWCQCWCQWCHMTQSHVAIHFDHLDLRNAWVPLASHDAYGSANGMTSPKKSCSPHFNCPDLRITYVHWHHMMPNSMIKKSHVAPHFNCLYLRNGMVPLMMLSVYCDTDASTSGVTWPKHHVAPHFNCPTFRNVMVSLIMQLVSPNAMPVPAAVSHDQKVIYYLILIIMT